MPADLYDRDLDMACTSGRTQAGFACTPTTAIARTTYATSASCADRIAADAYDEPPRFVTDLDPAACREDVHFLGVGSEIAPPPQVFLPGASCASITTPPSMHYYATSGEVPLAPMTEVPFTTGGPRIQPLRHRFGAAISDLLLQDTLLDAWCAPIADAAGTLRCIPLPVEVATYYTDPACMNPIDLAAVYTYAPCAPKTYRVGYRNSPVRSCPGTVDVYELGPARTGPVYRQVNSTCADFSPNAGVAYYPVTRRLDDEELAALTEVVEP